MLCHISEYLSPDSRLEYAVQWFCLFVSVYAVFCTWRSTLASSWEAKTFSFFLRIVIPQHVSTELVICWLGGIAEMNTLPSPLIHCKIMCGKNGFLMFSKILMCFCIWFVLVHIFRGRDKSVEWVISFHVYLGSQDQTEVIRLAKAWAILLSPNELF